jgi:hypothetical protein
VKAIEEEIKSLIPIEIVINNISVPINCTLVMTMVDSKVINSLTDTSSQICIICNCGPKNMSDLENLQKFTIREDNLRYELSTLYAWINFLRCILNILYKLNIHQSTSRMTNEQKDKLIQQKKNIQHAF